MNQDGQKIINVFAKSFDSLIWIYKNHLRGTPLSEAAYQYNYQIIHHARGVLCFHNSLNKIYTCINSEEVGGIENLYQIRKEFSEIELPDVCPFTLHDVILTPLKELRKRFKKEIRVKNQPQHDERV